MCCQRKTCENPDCTVSQYWYEMTWTTKLQSPFSTEIFLFDSPLLAVLTYWLIMSMTTPEFTTFVACCPLAVVWLLTTIILKEFAIIRISKQVTKPESGRAILANLPTCCKIWFIFVFSRLLFSQSELKAIAMGKERKMIWLCKILYRGIRV